MSVKPWFPAVVLFLCLAQAHAAPEFPDLSGRVIDEADLLTNDTEKFLTQTLATHESETTNQLVVVTLRSLQGYAIEDFGYQLGRHWGIGQKARNNGILLIVAPHERKVRIEVGYGLEGTLTDAISNNIIQTKILPHFRNQRYERGIVNGVTAILSALDGTYTVAARPQSTASLPSHIGRVLLIFIVTLILGEMIAVLFFKRRVASAVAIAVVITVASGILAGTFALGFIAGLVGAILHLFIGVADATGGGWGGGGSGYSGGYSSGSFGGGWSGGGGFSGGGGSFGGGGASGGW